MIYSLDQMQLLSSKFTMIIGTQFQICHVYYSYNKLIIFNFVDHFIKLWIFYCQTVFITYNSLNRTTNSRVEFFQYFGFSGRFLWRMLIHMNLYYIFINNKCKKKRFTNFNEMYHINMDMRRLGISSLIKFLVNRQSIVLFNIHISFVWHIFPQALIQHRCGHSSNNYSWNSCKRIGSSIISYGLSISQAGRYI